MIKDGGGSNGQASRKSPARTNPGSIGLDQMRMTYMEIK